MCIAAIINKAISWDFLREMENDNPHGAGVAYFDADKATIVFKRGLTAAEIMGMQEWGELTYPYLLHFRWATHGPRVPELTHPFPLGPRALHGELAGETDAVFIHNGVWSDYESYLPLIVAPVATYKHASDTAVAAYLLGVYPELQTPGRVGIVDDIHWAVAVAKVVGGEMVINKSGQTWVEYEGNTYSNLTWLPTKLWYNKFYQPNTGDSGWSWSGDSRIKPYEPARYDPAADLAKEAEVTQPFSWEDYVRARYGDEIAAGVAAAEAEEKTLEDIELAELECLPDLISDDGEEVNAWLARRMMVAM